MGLFGFGKKKEEINYSSGSQSSFGSGMDKSTDLNSGLGLEGLNSPQQEQQQFDPFGNPRAKLNYSEPDFGQGRMMQQGAQQTGDISKDIQIVIAKLDAIRAEVSNINHRLDMLENQNKQSQQRRYQW